MNKRTISMSSSLLAGLEGLEACRERAGCFFGVFGGILERCWGGLWGSLEASWEVLNWSWEVLEASWRHLGGCRRHLEGSWRHLEEILETFEAIVGAFRLL